MKKQRQLLILLLILAMSFNLMPAKTMAATPSLSVTSKTLYIGQILALKLKKASGKTVWSTTSKAIATVTSSGKIKAASAGKCKIKATNKKRVYSCSITVVAPALSASSKTLYVGQPWVLTLNNAVGKVTWSSSDKTVATVSNGIVKPRIAGKTKITAKNNSHSYTCTVTVSKPALSAASKSLYIGQSFTLKTNPAGLPVTWDSTEPSVATVSTAGKVTAADEGTTVIRGVIYGKTYSCTVTVKKPELSDSSLTLYPGDSYHVMCTDSAVKVTSWKSSRKNVATVNSLGVIRAVQPGTTTITAKIYSHSYTCTVTVTRVSALSRYGIPDYWEEELNTSISTIRAKQVAMSRHSCGFLYFTDAHWKKNAQVSPGIINYLSPLLNMNCVFGGDIIATYDTTKQEAFDELYDFYDQFQVPLFTAIGNHDNNAMRNPDNDTILNEDEMYTLLLRQEEGLADTSGTCDYAYFDNVSQKVRYISFFYDAHHSITDEMYAWIDDKVTELPEGWTVIFFSHAAFLPTASGDAPDLSKRGNKFIEHILDLKATVHATIACWITGHIHRDYSMSYMKGDQSFLVISTNCDTYKISTKWGGWEMTKGTSTEQCIDAVQLDLDKREIYMTRIGAGEDRYFTY